MDLVVGSVGRTEAVGRLLLSLGEQRSQDFKLFVVEQRDLGGISRLVEHFTPSFEVELVPSQPGLSAARNLGLSLGTAPIVGFPDDDCWYLPNTVRDVLKAFARDPQLDLLCVRQRGHKGQEKFMSGERTVNRCNVWNLGVSSALFARRSLVESIGGFSEALGVGSKSPYQSGEETDLILRALAGGARCVFEPGIAVGHPVESETPGRLHQNVGYGYGLGMGYVLGSHGYGRAVHLSYVLRPSAGSVVALLQGRPELARFRRSVAIGRWRGYEAQRRRS